MKVVTHRHQTDVILFRTRAVFVEIMEDFTYAIIWDQFLHLLAVDIHIPLIAILLEYVIRVHQITAITEAPSEETKQIILLLMV